MTTPFTDVDAAVAEGHFIQHSLNKTAYIVCDDKSLLFVLTEIKSRIELQPGRKLVSTTHIFIMMQQVSGNHTC